MKAARRAFRQRARRLIARGARFIFVDEFGTNLGMTRRYARAVGGARAVGHAPVNADPNVTLVLGLSSRGIVAPMAMPGAQDGRSFETYVASQLAPRLRPGDVVVVDGLGAHRGRAARAAVHRRGAHYLILPPYSPDLSPVEEAGAKLKSAVRAEAPRSLVDLYDALGRAIGTVTRADARGWFRHRATYLFGRTIRTGPPL